MYTTQKESCIKFGNMFLELWDMAFYLLGIYCIITGVYACQKIHSHLQIPLFFM